MPRTLVTYACSNAATYLFASYIYALLVEQKKEVDLRWVMKVTSVDAYDAVILGSELDQGHVHEDGVELLDSLQRPLSKKTLWLYKCGTAHPEGMHHLYDARTKETLAPLLQLVKPKELKIFSEDAGLALSAWSKKLITHLH